MPSDMDSEDEDMKLNTGGDPKKMTDEEKRRNFLERNRYVEFYPLTFTLRQDRTNCLNLVLPP